MNKTSIEWTHRPGTTGMTWNPIRARQMGDMADGTVVQLGKPGTFCTRISPGCTNCYASVINKRFGNGLEFTVPNLEKVEYFVSEKILGEPLLRKKPATIFVGDMFDLFHEAIADGLIRMVLAIVAQCPHHTFQILTKRSGRMERFMEAYYQDHLPYTNLWVGVSIESQEYAEQRIPELLCTPAEVRFLSVEPMLGPVDLDGMWLDLGDEGVPVVDWVICGGESGPGARPFDLAWAESLLKRCREYYVPFFMKQIGSHPNSLAGPRSKGGDMEFWPPPLRVREFPA